jgi:23S rRNA (uridine2552-2'-O)-methyltransferase
MPERRRGKRGSGGRGAGHGGGRAGYERKDSFYRRAKEEGYRSRAAYKLLEAAERYRLIARGARVLDLGCWPGGWLQVAVELAGPSGTVVGIDLKETEPISGATVLTGDVTAAATIERLRAAVPGGVYDVVLADLAPNLSGIRFRDEARAAELNQMTLAVADELLRPGGALLMKTFMSGETEELLRRARRSFAAVRLTAVEASRKGSAEQYLIARDKRPRQRE